MESPRKPERQGYGFEQLELLRILMEKEGCTSGMIHELTGIPAGSASMIFTKFGVTSEGLPGGRGGKVGAIRRARTISLLREKYKDEISRIFKKEKGVNDID